MLLITDLDDTIADARWRENLRIAGNWDAFHSAASEDKPFESVSRCINAMHQKGWLVLCCTTRPIKYRQLSLVWMLNHNIPVDTLLMRPEGDYRSSPELKPVLVEPYVKANQDGIILAIDDREDVVAAYNAMGIAAFQAFPRH